MKHLITVLFTALLLASFIGCSKTENQTAQQPATAQSTKEAKSVKVELSTNKGNIVLELDAEKAPASTENFLNYVRDGHYDGTIFHRVIPGFMVQGGGFDSNMQQKPSKAPIKNEADNGLKNDVGTVAMARTNDPDSATAQFFINVKSNDFLNHSSPSPQGWGYAVFAKVVEGMDVVQAIEKVATGSKGMHQDVPVEDVTITKASIVD